ncbi:EAL domain-containing protein [Novosphingobium sp. PASSN1]|uniref:putative bifunctional diguanylate cyclase/phosphodiesterase n=1 Tax=Novosphingobium sp. PASSN1 TaxID=2015561 RepID=UPI000BD4482C|nr:EAL domain-containing protein [Novosphingobium sp. PASSN1]OYU37101.1 MAG: bifunctional diguanylate cyclase/phosphodiesterase [Novosphingobium sp. PASSN1]
MAILKQEAIPLPPESAAHGAAAIARLERLVQREREGRLQAEAIAERGLRELYESQVRLALLQRITECANRSNDFSDAIDEVLKEICEHMNWAFGTAYRVDRGGTAVSCNAWYTAQPARMFALVEATREASFPCGEGVPGRVLRDGHPHWIDEGDIETTFCRRSEAADCGIRSVCGFPVMIAEEIVCVLEFFSAAAMIDKDAILLTVTQAATQLARVIERERARAALLHDALHDAMTGLPNRSLLDERSRAAFERLPESREGLAVLVIDLDGFKAINDKYGHHAGDIVLVETARRFDAVITSRMGGRRNGDQPGWRATLARVGGDEFVVVLDALADPGIALDLSGALIEALKAPIRVADEFVNVGLSIGIAHSGPGYASVEQLRQDADLAMYEAKSGGHGGVVTFSEALGSERRNRMALENELRDAIREKQFTLFYQPIFALGGAAISSGAIGSANRRGRLRGFEALIRWNHPDQGLVEPGHFIPAAEAGGLIVFIGDWVLRQACSAMARLHADLARSGLQAGELPYISINIAPQQFLQPSFSAHVQRVLLETGVLPELVRLEVTEGVAIIDPDQTRQVLEQVRSWGVKTSLDDFGTGYSSLSYLQNLPFDTLKIDRSFIASMDDPKSRKIIRAILDLASNLNLSVVAEGIETGEQGASLREMGCEFGQGYHLGRPLDEASAFALIWPEAVASPA